MELTIALKSPTTTWIAPSGRLRIFGLGVGSSEASLIVEELAEFIVALKFSEVVVLSAYEFHGFEFWCRGMDRTSTRPAFPLPTQVNAALALYAFRDCGVV